MLAVERGCQSVRRELRHRQRAGVFVRAEKPVYRIGIVALSLAAALLLVAVDARTNDLIPLFTIGVFVGFTLSQLGLVRHWSSEPASAGTRSSTTSGPGCWPRC
jgi:hypothetical protein